MTGDLEPTQVRTISRSIDDSRTPCCTSLYPAPYPFQIIPKQTRCAVWTSHIRYFRILGRREGQNSAARACQFLPVNLRVEESRKGSNLVFRAEDVNADKDLYLVCVVPGEFFDFSGQRWGVFCSRWVGVTQIGRTSHRAHFKNVLHVVCGTA